MACGESLGQFLKPRVSSTTMDNEINLYGFWMTSRGEKSVEFILIGEWILFSFS